MTHTEIVKIDLTPWGWAWRILIGLFNGLLVGGLCAAIAPIWMAVLFGAFVATVISGIFIVAHVEVYDRKRHRPGGE